MTKKRSSVAADAVGTVASMTGSKVVLSQLTRNESDVGINKCPGAVVYSVSCRAGRHPLVPLQHHCSCASATVFAPNLVLKSLDVRRLLSSCGRAVLCLNSHMAGDGGGWADVAAGCDLVVVDIPAARNLISESGRSISNRLSSDGSAGAVARRLTRAIGVPSIVVSPDRIVVAVPRGPVVEAPLGPDGSRNADDPDARLTHTAAVFALAPVWAESPIDAAFSAAALDSHHGPIPSTPDQIRSVIRDHRRHVHATLPNRTFPLGRVAAAIAAAIGLSLGLGQLVLANIQSANFA